MKPHLRLWNLAGAFAVCWLLSVSAMAQNGPEEQALQEMATAKDVATIERHLPEVVRSQISQLSAEQRREFDRTIFIPDQMRKEGIRLRAPADEHALLILEHVRAGAEGEAPSEALERLEIRVEKKIANGAEAVLQLVIVENEREQSREDPLQVWMKLEDGEWRVTEFGSSGGASVKLDEEFVERLKTARLNGNEASAAGSMRTLNTALVTYAAMYPEIGFPETLEVLGLDANRNDEPNERHAGLIDEVLASGTKSGYRFTYAVEPESPRSSYRITGRPMQYGTAGRRSFYTDESCVIRFTEEDREPTHEDPPLH